MSNLNWFIYENPLNALPAKVYLDEFEIVIEDLYGDVKVDALTDEQFKKCINEYFGA